MDELTFIQHAAAEVTKSSNKRLKGIYEWCRDVLTKTGSCGGYEPHQSLHAALAAADILLKVALVEETGEYVSPHRVDSMLNDTDQYVPMYFYQYNKTLSTVTLDIAFYSNILHTKTTVIDKVWKPLVISLDSSATTPQPESNSIILAK